MGTHSLAQIEGICKNILFYGHHTIMGAWPNPANEHILHSYEIVIPRMLPRAPGMMMKPGAIWLTKRAGSWPVGTISTDWFIAKCY